MYFNRVNKSEIVDYLRQGDNSYEVRALISIPSLEERHKIFENAIKALLNSEADKADKKEQAIAYLAGLINDHKSRSTNQRPSDKPQPFKYYLPESRETLSRIFERHRGGIVSGLGLATSALVALGIYSSLPDYTNSSAPDHGVMIDVADIETPSAVPSVSGHPDTVEEPSVSISPEDTDFLMTLAGYERGSAGFAFALACQNTDDRYKKYCQAVIRTSDATGIDPYVLMAKVAMETNFRVLPDDTKLAQGMMQIQPGFLITKLHEHGRDLPFYQALDDNDPRRIAIDQLLNDRGDDGDRARIMHSGFLLGDYPDEMYRILSDLRFDIDFSMQLSALSGLEHVPEAIASHFTGTCSDSGQGRQDVTAKIYFIHNQGGNGAPQIMDLAISHPTWNASSEGLEAILHSGFTLEELTENMNENPSVFPLGAETTFGHVLTSIQTSVNERMVHFNWDIHNACIASQQSFENYLESGGIDVAQTYYNPDPTPTTSQAPQSRPLNLGQGA